MELCLMDSLSKTGRVQPSGFDINLTATLMKVYLSSKHSFM